jgi:hypothetical protein
MKSVSYPSGPVFDVEERKTYVHELSLFVSKVL